MVRERIEDGKYNGKILKISARACVDVQLEDGRIVSEWYDLMAAKSRDFMKRELAKTGAEFNGLKELVQKRPEIEGRTVCITAKTKANGYQSIYFERPCELTNDDIDGLTVYEGTGDFGYSGDEEIMGLDDIDLGY